MASYRKNKTRPPAKEILMAEVENEIENDMMNLIYSEIELNFWKDILSDIKEARKTVENISLNLSVEAKALQHEHYLDTLPLRQ